MDEPAVGARGSGTRDQLIATARKLFAERGYANVGTEELVKRSGVTRGALYYHFADKRDLFLAVYGQMEAEIVQEIVAAVAEISPDDPLGALELGIRCFLDACEDPARIQVGLVDAPAVLGWNEWRRVGAEHGFGLVSGALEAARDAGQLRKVEIVTIAHLLIGALGEAAMLLAHAKDRKRTRRDVEAGLFAFLDGLRA